MLSDQSLPTPSFVLSAQASFAELCNQLNQSNVDMLLHDDMVLVLANSSCEYKVIEGYIPSGALG